MFGVRERYSRHLGFKKKRKIRESRKSNQSEGISLKGKEGGSEGEKKNTPACSHCSFGKLRLWANRVSDWCGVVRVD